MTSYIDWPGKSGKSYRYWFLAGIEAKDIKPDGRNYCFVKQLPNGNFLPLYFGEGKSLKGRIPGHEVWPDAVKLGATHAMAHTTPAGEQARLDEERDLIAQWNPSLNTQHRTKAS